MFHIGPTNTAKSFLAKPLAVIYRAYRQPDKGSYPLELLPEAEIVLLNDFTWDEAFMSWSYMKNFMEGGSIPIAKPKNRGKDEVCEKDSPVVGTAPAPIQLLVRDRSRSVVHQDETLQMNSRIQYLYMNVAIPAHAVIRARPCPCCGAHLYLEGREGWRATLATPSARSSSPRAARPRPTTFVSV